LTDKRIGRRYQAPAAGVFFAEMFTPPGRWT